MGLIRENGQWILLERVASSTDALSSGILCGLYYIDRRTNIELLRDGEQITSLGHVYQMLV